MDTYFNGRIIDYWLKSTLLRQNVWITISGRSPRKADCGLWSQKLLLVETFNNKLGQHFRCLAFTSLEYWQVLLSLLSKNSQSLLEQYRRSAANAPVLEVHRTHPLACM